MDQNQKTDSDLQKAIDDITKNTNSDPVFSDPVPAPMLSESDLGNLDEAVGPFTDTSKPDEDIKPDLGTPPAPLDASNPPVMPPNDGVVLGAESTPSPEISNHPAEMNPTAEKQSQPSGDMLQIKKEALKDLMPLMDKMNINPSQKFRIYKDMIDSFNDTSAIEPAYRAVKDITDEKERGEALLYLIETIDKKDQ